MRSAMLADDVERRTARSPAAMPWWRGAAIYQIYPRSFADSQRRRHRRPAGHHRAARLCREPRRRRDLALAVLHLADARLRLRRRRLLRRRSDVRHARRLRRAGRASARARPQGDHRPGLFAQLRPASLVPGKPVEPRQCQGRLVRLGRRQGRTARRPTTGCRSSAGRPGNGTRGAANITCTISWPSSPTSTSTIRRCRTRCSTVARFWLERGVDGFRLDAINFAMHDPELRDNPPAPAGGKRTRPFDFQQHLYNQSHPDIVELPRAAARGDRRLWRRFTVAEVGGDHALAEMHAFTAGRCAAQQRLRLRLPLC